MSLIQKLNNETHINLFVNAKDLKVGKKLKIICFNKIDTRYGEKVLVQFTEESEVYKTILPSRFTEKFSDEIIEDFNEDIKKGKEIYLISKGPVGKTTNIEFTEE